MKIIIIITIKTFWENVHINNISMLYCYGIGVSGDIDINKTSTSKDYIICLY